MEQFEVKARNVSAGYIEAAANVASIGKTRPGPEPSYAPLSPSAPLRGINTNLSLFYCLV